MCVRTCLVAAVLTVGSIALPARADVEAVNKYLGEATELVDKGSSFFDDAGAKLELAQSSMDDVPEAQKAALQAKIDALKAKIDSAANDQASKILDGKIKRAMDDAEGSIGNLVTWKGAADQVKEYLDDPKTTTLLGADAVAKYRKEFAGFVKLNGGKALKVNLESAKTQVDALEKDWGERKTTLGQADASPNDKSGALNDTQHDLEEIERFFQDLPADNADVKALRARVDKVKSDHAAAASGAGAGEVLKSIDRFLALYKNDFAGMEAEGGPPPLADLKSGKSSAEGLGAPKTAAFVSRVGDYLDDLPKDDAYGAAKDAPAVKSKVDDLTKQVAAGRAKLTKNAETLVAAFEAEKANADNVDKADVLSSAVGNALGSDSDEAKPLIARLAKFQADFKTAGVKADADKDAYYKKMTEQADKAWPDMMAKFDVAEGFDPNNAGAMKGKFIKITSNNLMGYRFKPTDFPYATTLNGVPVAGKYDPAIQAALAEVEGKLGRSIGDSDDDGKWIAICRVEGTSGKLTQLIQHEGDVNVDGSKVGTVSGTEERSVDAPIVTIVALKAGPVAAAAGQGTVKEDGSVGKSVAPVGGALASGGAGMTNVGGHHISFFGILMGLIAIGVGAACLMKAKFAPLATNAGAMQFTDKVGGQNLEYLGLVGVGLGVVGVLMNLIALPGAFVAALIGLLASLAMLVAGGVASREFFEKRGILPANVGPLLTQFAIPAGLTSAVLGLLTLIVSVV